MDLKISRETIPAAVSVYDGIQEQPVELDYILPDYYPDIFRLVRCEVKPVITGWTVSGDKLSYELRCDISILYCGEGDSVLRSVTQTQSFQKTVELGSECASPEVRLTPKTDHINFRAVNKRRLDLRGAVSVKTSVTCQSQQEVISDVSGMNMQLRRVPMRFAAKKLTADKQLRVSVETELSAARPSVINIISSRCAVKDCEQKLISGKLLAKGELKVDVLYSCEKDGSGSVEPMSFTLPYSQIIDIDGIDESFICRITPEVIACEVTAAAGKTGENRALHCEAELRLMCRAVKNTDPSDDVDMITGARETKDKFYFTYGIVEVRLKTIRHKGNFPAAWMMPQPPTETWPNAGEIDIFETIDNQQRAWHTVHTNWTYNMGNKGNSSYNEWMDVDDWHVYGLEWSEEEIQWTVDGEVVGHYEKSPNDYPLECGQWPFTKPFYIILNQSVGMGTWAANPDLDFTYETRFDYVRVYQRDETGIRDVRNSKASCGDDVIYDLQGRSLMERPQQGVCIVNGKKTVR